MAGTLVALFAVSGSLLRSLAIVTVLLGWKPVPFTSTLVPAGPKTFASAGPVLGGTRDKEGETWNGVALVMGLLTTGVSALSIVMGCAPVAFSGTVAEAKSLPFESVVTSEEVWLAAFTSDPVDTLKVALGGSPSAETVTALPAGAAEGLTATDGVEIVNGTLTES
jgi:hypothetical protein